MLDKLKKYWLLSAFSLSLVTPWNGSCVNAKKVEKPNIVQSSPKEESLEDKMRYVQDVKKYGQEHFGLVKSKNYVKFRSKEEAKGHMLYVLYVAPELYLPELKSDYQYIGYTTKGRHAFRFEEKILMIQSHVDDLVDEAEDYNSWGYDTKRRVLTDYDGDASLTEEFLNSPKHEFVSVIYHEDWHATAYAHKKKYRDIAIEEAMATNMGYFLAIQFFNNTKDYNNMKNEEKVDEEWLRFSKDIKMAYDTLQSVYSDPNLNRKEKLRVKREITSYLNAHWSSGHFNNAKIFMQASYTYYYPLLHKIIFSSKDVKKLVGYLLTVPYSEKEAEEYLKRGLK